MTFRIAPLRPRAWAGMPCSPWLLDVFATHARRCRSYGHPVQRR